MQFHKSVFVIFGGDLFEKNTVKQYRLGDLVSFEQGLNSARAKNNMD